MIKLRSNLIGGILTVIIGVVLMILLPSQIEVGKQISENQVSSSFVPWIIIMVIIILGIILIVQSILMKKEKIVEINTREIIRVGILLAILAAYVALFSLLGFIISTLLMSFGILFFLRIKDWMIYGICGTIVIAVYFIFTLFLNVKLP